MGLADDALVFITNQFTVIITIIGTIVTVGYKIDKRNKGEVNKLPKPNHSKSFSNLISE